MQEYCANKWDSGLEKTISLRCQALQHIDMLHLLGEMAVSIGHHVRNPLTTVRGYLQIFKRKEHFSQYAPQLSVMIEEIDRVNTVITEFLALAKNKRVDLQQGNLNTVVTALVPLIQSDALKSGHYLKLELNNLPEVRFDKREISQLLLHLVINSQEAMPVGGTITVRTSAADGYVYIAVEDNGPGIPDEIMDRLGTPFITTKDSSVGLGLAICYMIAEHHQAGLHIKTSNQGTIVSISFKVQ
jgi:signal transduction histidine kinase